MDGNYTSLTASTFQPFHVSGTSLACITHIDFFSVSGI